MAFDAGGASSLEQFTLLAKNARGRACVALVQQVLTNKKLFVFRELLDMPNVEALQNTENHGYYELLRIFCFGTYGDYLGALYIGISSIMCVLVDAVLICVLCAVMCCRSTKGRAARADPATGPEASQAHDREPRASIQGKQALSRHHHFTYEFL